MTRPKAQAEEFAIKLAEFGAEVLRRPTIQIVPPADPEPLGRIVRTLDRVDWIVFTSVNGVAYFWEALRAAGLDTSALAGISLCAIGPVTASAIQREGARADLVAEEHVAEGVVSAMARRVPLTGTRILLPQAEGAREVLAESLRELGAEVMHAVVYRTIPDGSAIDRLRAELAAGQVDMITFTSSSAVESFVAQVGSDVGTAHVASIGPITSRTARSFGMRVDIEGDPYTTSGLNAAIVRFYGGNA